MKGRSVRFRLALYFGGAGALTLLITLLRSIALCAAFDAEIGYFRQGALSIIIYILQALGLVAAFAPLVLFQKDELRTERAPLSTVGLVAAGAAALSLIATAAYLVVRAVSAAGGSATTVAPLPLMLLAALLFAAACGYFALQFLGKPHKAAPFGYAVILAAVLLLSITYFDRYTQMNAPHKLSVHMAMLAIAVFLLYELRTFFGIARPRALAVTSAICFGVCASGGLSNLVGFLAGRYEDPLYLMADLVAVAMAFYVGARAVADLLAASTDKEEGETV